jgi:hypothetical protein
VPERLRIPRDKMSTTGRWLPFDEYPAELSRTTVGMVPLQKSRFNDAKSCLKLAEYSAVGVPTVAAPTPDNRRLHGYGVGLLASSSSEWRRHLGELMGSEDYRAEVSARSRAAMAAHTYEQWADLWLTAWEKALDRKPVAV